MTPNDDNDVLARFNGRLAGIESDVKDGFPAEMPRQRPVTRSIAWRSESPGRRVFVPLFVAIALIASIVVIRPLLMSSTPSASTVGSLPAVGSSASASADLGLGLAGLRIQAYVSGQSEPSGIDAPGGLSAIHFTAVISSAGGSEVVSIPADLDWRELVLTPGRYDVVVSEREIVVNADNGQDVISDLGQCSTQVDLAADRTKLLVASTSLLTPEEQSGYSCTILETGGDLSDPSLAAPSPTSLPSTRGTPSPLPKGLLTEAQAVARAREEVPDGAAYRSISAGTFAELDLTADRNSLRLLVAPDHLVWAIHFSNSSATCSAENTCGETVVYLDYVRGNFLVSVRVPAAP